MTDRPHQNEQPTEQAVRSGPGLLKAMFARWTRMLGFLLAWSSGHWLRSVIVAGSILALIAATMAGWAYLASVALRTGELSIDGALTLLDEGRHEEARATVVWMLKQQLLERSEYGGPLYVLGAVKMHDAEKEPSARRRQIEYLVASRYLEEARAHGLPPGRSDDGLFMLGKCLVECGQFEEGLEVLDQLVDTVKANDARALEIRRYLAESCLQMPNPKVEQALEHNKTLLATPGLTDAQRANALAIEADCLSRLKQFDKARENLAAIPAGTTPTAAVQLLEGKIRLDELASTLQRIAPDGRTAAASERKKDFTTAIKLLREAYTQDAQKSHVTRQASYQLGRAYELQNNSTAALKNYARTRQFFGDTFEGLAASLCEADLLRQRGDRKRALLGYRQVLDSIKSMPIYHGLVMPLAEVRDRMMFALKDLIAQRHFAEALLLIDHFQPLFSSSEQLELRGGTLERWGQALISDVSGDSVQADEQRAEGREKLRAAGVAFEQLAELRFASRQYTENLWRSAENFSAGHSFSSTVRLLNQYLQNEPELRNAEALLRLGQAYLATGQLPQSVAAFEECIEFHKFDSSTFQARIDCAKAYWRLGDASRAEKLLRENLVGSTLRPSSREWKDSLFELGMLLHGTGQYEQAIVVLEEAIERYKQDSQRLAAQYVLGESYRRWAHDLIDRAGQAHTTGERDKTMQLANERLTAALKHFEEVQVSITLKTNDLHSDPLLGTMLRNCYMLEGTVLFDLGRFKEAIEAFSNVASLYPDNPFVLETFVQIANCWRRLGQDVKARGAIQQAQIVLQGLPPDTDFASTTALNRDEWGILLADMCKW